jgi:hypothetical protein
VQGVRRLLAGWSQAQQRVERTPAGQSLISVVVVIILITGIAWVLPDSPIRRHLVAPAAPVALSAGLDQNWGVFAPDPPRVMQYLTFEVTFADGHEVRWDVPHGDPVFGQYSWYHWQKIKENMLKTPGLRPGFARWVANHVAGAGGRPVRVRMVLRSVSLPPPGSASTGRTSTRILYDEPLAGG